MKRIVKAYLSFTSIERKGLLGLFAFIIILLFIRATMVFWVQQPSMNSNEEKILLKAWETFRRDNPNTHFDDTSGTVTSDYADANDDNETPLPAIIDINTADSETLVRYRGIGPATAGKIVARVKQKGPFTDIQQLMEVRSFPKETFDMLKKHLAIGKPDSSSQNGN